MSKTFLKSIDFNTLYFSRAFDSARRLDSVADEDALAIALLCAENKEKFFERMCDAILEGEKGFSIFTSDFEYYTFEELVKKFKETGKEFILQWNHSPFEDCGLALTVEEEKGLDKQEDSTFVYHLTLEGFLEAIAKAYQNEKDEGKPLNKDFEYFAGNSTPENLTNFFKCDWDISNIEVKKKRLFSKGYAKAHVKGHIEKPQVLIDLQNKINEKLKGTNYVCVALPWVTAVLDAEKVSSDFCFTNPDKKSGDEYRRAERDLIARIKDKTQFNIEMDCKWNEYGPSSEEAIREHFKADDPSFAICIFKQN